MPIRSFAGAPLPPPPGGHRRRECAFAAPTAVNAVKRGERARILSPRLKTPGVRTGPGDGFPVAGSAGPPLAREFPVPLSLGVS